MPVPQGPNVVEIPATETSAGLTFGETQERALMLALNMVFGDSAFGTGGDRQALAQALGRRTFRGRRDLVEVLGYSEAPTYAEFWSRYQRQDIAQRVIDLPVNQTWGGGALQVEGWPEWENFNKELEVQSRMTELDRLASIGSFAVLLFGVAQQADQAASPETVERALLEPVESISGLDQILYLQQYGQDAVSIKETDSNPLSPRFGKPVVYQIEVITGLRTQGGFGASSRTTSTKTIKLQVHYSRVLHVTPNRIISDTVGFSRLLSILDRLQDLDKVVGGASEMFWLGADRSLVLSRTTGSGGAGSTAAGSQTARDDVQAQAEEFAHGLRRILMLTNSDATTLQPNQVDPSGLVQSIFQLISAGSDTPLRILVGSERGELASSQDRANFADTIANRRSNFAQPQIWMALIKHLNAWGVAPDPNTLTLVWPPIEILNAEERSEVESRRVESMKRAEEAIALGGAAFTAEDFRSELGFEGAGPSAAITGQGVDVDESDPEVQRQFERGRQLAPVG